MCGVIQYNGRGRHCHVCARPSISLCSACWGLAAARAVRCAALRVAPAGTRRRAGASRAAALIVGRSSPHTRRSFIGAALIGHSLPRLECHYKYKPRFERHYKMSRIYNGFRLSIRPVSLLSQEFYGHSNCGGAGRRRGEGRDREITDCLLTRKYRSAATTFRNFADLSFPGEVPATEALESVPYAMPASGSESMKREQNFINKTWAMVNGGHPEISWDETGTLIVVKNPERLAAHVLPMYFRHNQYASWVRALNAHDFKKSGPDRWQHQYFVQDQPDLLVQIKRKAAPARSSATGRASGSDTSAGSSTAIVRVPKRSYSPARLGRLEQQLVTADILNEERKSLWVMQQQMVQMETSLADVTDETFRQRFDTVRLMHMMLQRLLVVPDPSAGPPIRLHPRHTTLQLTDGCSPSKLAADGDVAMGDGALGDVAMDEEALGIEPILSDAGMHEAHDGAPSRLRGLPSEDLLRMLTTSSLEPTSCTSPWKSQRPSAGAAATAGAPSASSSASSSSASSSSAAAAAAAASASGSFELRPHIPRAADGARTSFRRQPLRRLCSDTGHAPAAHRHPCNGPTAASYSISRHSQHAHTAGIRAHKSRARVVRASNVAATHGSRRVQPSSEPFVGAQNLRVHCLAELAGI